MWFSPDDLSSSLLDGYKKHQNFLCEDCKEIIDVLYPYGEKPEKIVCPECGSENLKKWNPKTGKCPKCGGELEKTGTVLMVD